MCLSIKVDRPGDVLAEGKHLGHEWTVTHNKRGYRCGYVKVEPGHPWHGIDIYAAMDSHISCHGGPTFAEADVPCDKDGPDNAWWIGFDCAHAWDAPDPELPGSEPDIELNARFKLDDIVVRTQEYVEEQCRLLCEQADSATVVVSTAEVRS